jgi:hypothetical protein
MFEKTNKKYAIGKIILLCIFLLDVCYTFKQNYGKRLDGDLVSIVLPGENYAKVLTDPFGLNVLLYKEKYGATNRYFCHKTMQIWFNQVEHFIGYFFSDKVTALYVTCALFNTLVYLFFIFLISLYIHLNTKFNSIYFLLSILLSLPFMQVNGFNSIALIDKSITYTFFYGFPICLLLLYVFPLYKYIIQLNKINYNLIQHICWILLAIYLAFGGTLIQPIVLFSLGFSMLILGYRFLIAKNKTIYLSSKKKQLLAIPKYFIFHGLYFTALCLYSFYIGKFNIENPTETPTILERYSLLLIGFKSQFTSDISYFLFFILFIINFIFLQKINETSTKFDILKFTPTLLLFSLLYIVSLPFGGYRPYRPLIIRYDLISPINFLIIFFATYTTWLVLCYSRNKIYYLLLSIVFILFLIKDKPEFHSNKWEKQQLRLFATTQQDTLIINKDYNLLLWDCGSSFYATRHNTQIIYKWKISKKPIYYIQQ